MPAASATPEADWAEWLARREPATQTPPSLVSTDESEAKGAAEKPRLNERDRWFLEQRPPHWG